MNVSTYIGRDQSDLTYNLHKFTVASWTSQTSVCSVPFVVALIADHSLAFDSMRHRNMRVKRIYPTMIGSDGDHMRLGRYPATVE